MAKEHQVFIARLHDTAEKTTVKLAGKSRQDSDAQENRRLALAHLVQITGEAGRRVAEPFGDAHPEIPWRQLIGMRHLIVNGNANPTWPQNVAHMLAPVGRRLGHGV